MSTGDPYYGFCRSIPPCSCYTKVDVARNMIQPVYKSSAVPLTQSHVKIDNAILRHYSMGRVMRCHLPYSTGQLAMINWALVEGTDALLYESEAARPNFTTNVISIENRKQLYLFEGRELVIILQDADEFTSEVKIAYGEKIGWINAYLLLPVNKKDVKRFGARQRAATKKTADRTLGDMGAGDSAIDGTRRHVRTHRR